LRKNENETTQVFHYDFLKNPIIKKKGTELVKRFGSPRTIQKKKVMAFNGQILEHPQDCNENKGECQNYPYLFYQREVSLYEFVPPIHTLN
jgi:hypothetical protein